LESTSSILDLPTPRARNGCQRDGKQRLVNAGPARIT
jgi:hypothetical protein